MSLYLPPKKSGSSAVAICGRCSSKVYHDDLVEDPNNKLWVCKECKDILDPWRKPPRRAEKISLQHPRPDTDLE